MESIQLVNLSPDEFRGMLREEVSARMNQLLKELKPEEVELMTEASACRLLKINVRTLKRMSMERIIPCIPIGNGRFRYSKKVLLENFDQIQSQKCKRHD
jgi:hypothetical protein